MSSLLIRSSAGEQLKKILPILNVFFWFVEKHAQKNATTNHKEKRLFGLVRANEIRTESNFWKSSESVSLRKGEGCKVLVAMTSSIISLKHCLSLQITNYH
jgi:hypothetical protein